MDIKPSNIMYSPSAAAFVFIDFGYSRMLKEPTGHKSWTTFTGTFSYCSQDMEKLFNSFKGDYIDLYHNDSCSFKISLK